MRFIDHINNAQPVTPRIHALELIPGIGKTYMLTIIREREKKKFDSFADLQARVGLRDPSKLIVKRIVEEIAGQANANDGQREAARLGRPRRLEGPVRRPGAPLRGGLELEAAAGDDQPPKPVRGETGSE